MISGGGNEGCEWVLLYVHVQKVGYCRYESANTCEANIFKPIS